MNTLAVMAHGAAEAIFQRNLPMWNGKADRTLLLCPVDDPVRSVPSGWVLILFGSQGIYTESSCKRLAGYLQELCRATDGPVFLCEYDAGPTRGIPWPLCASGNTLFSNGWPDSREFIAHPPYLMNRETLGILAAHLQAVIATEFTGLSALERTFTDRFIGNAVTEKKVNSIGWGRDLNCGFTKNTIEPDDVPLLESYLCDRPGCMVHGVKSQAALDVVRKFST